MRRMAAAGAALARVRSTLTTGGAMTHCGHCGTAARVRAGACPLCGRALDSAGTGPLAALRRRGVLELSVVVVLAVVFVSMWTVVFLHR